MKEAWVRSLGREDPLENMATYSRILSFFFSFPEFFLKKSHGQRGLAGYNPCSHKELDTTERLSMHAHYTILGRYKDERHNSCP